MKTLPFARLNCSIALSAKGFPEEGGLPAADERVRPSQCDKARGAWPEEPQSK